MDHVLTYREPRKRLKAVDTVPKDMSSSYADVIQRIEHSEPGDRELGFKVLSWLFHAKRTLSMNELLEALAVEEFELNQRLDDILHDMLSPRDVIECCKSLVGYDEPSGLISFTHF